MLTISQKEISLKGPTYCWELICVLDYICFVTCDYIVEILVLGELWTCGSGISCYIYENIIILNNFMDVIYSRSSFNSSVFSTVLRGFAVFLFLTNLGGDRKSQIQRTEHL